LSSLDVQADPDIKAVAVVHNETATGVTSDIPRIRQTMDDAGSDALLLVRLNSCRHSC
jgi:alanine-glyoxylate transaminase / serine-glyoxylate transaminase / serine-pyruvate transaminase